MVYKRPTVHTWMEQPLQESGRGSKVQDIATLIIAVSIGVPITRLRVSGCS